MRLRSLMLAASAFAAMLVPAVFSAAPAQAATADAWGFALVDNPTVPLYTTLNTTRQWGTWKTAFPADFATGGKVANGRFMVKFPHIGLGSRGVPHVTAISNVGRYCELVRWFQSGADEYVDVACFAPGGVPTDTQFTVMWTVSSGIIPAANSHAYVQLNSAGAIVQGYNSTGGYLSAGPAGVGQYTVKLGGVGAAGVVSGNVQVTAIQPNLAPRRCKVTNWFPSGPDVIVNVSCYNQAGALTATEFTLSYHRQRSMVGSFLPPKYFGYIDTSTAGQTNWNNPLGAFGANTVTLVSAPNIYLVRYPQLALAETSTQVTAVGPGPNYCTLTQPWIYAGPDANVYVSCFDAAGAPAAHRFLSTFTSRG